MDEEAIRSICEASLERKPPPRRFFALLPACLSRGTPRPEAPPKVDGPTFKDKLVEMTNSDFEEII